jgi:hypothetical protein
MPPVPIQNPAVKVFFDSFRLRCRFIGGQSLEGHFLLLLFVVFLSMLSERAKRFGFSLCRLLQAHFQADEGFLVFEEVRFACWKFNQRL